MERAEFDSDPVAGGGQVGDDGGVPGPGGETLAAEAGGGVVDIVIRDVGSANPRAASLMAELFGLPIEAVVAAVYRAPSRLVAGLEPSLAEQLVSGLANLGLALEIVPGGGAVAPNPTLDVAAEIADPALVDAATDVIAEFLGVPREEALELLMTTPGVILGNVSRATIDALERRLPAGALTLTTADPAQSRYALFADALAPADRAAVDAVLHNAASAGDGLVALDLSHAEANALWRRLARVPNVRLVNQAFLRFEMVLTEIASVDPATAAALETLAGVPAEALAELAALLPVVVEDGVPHDRVAARLRDYAAYGLTVSARLANFAEQVLVVDSAPPEALALLGIDSAAPLPLRLPPLAAPRARLARHRLEAAGADVSQFAAEDAGG